MITHLCKNCEASVEVGRCDVTTMTSGPRFMWGRWERCTCCGSTAAPLEVVDANDRRLGVGQWEHRTSSTTSGHLSCGWCVADGMDRCPLHGETR